MWKYYAILSAVFAALTTIFAKIGLKNVDSNLATAIRTCVIILLLWGIVIFSDSVGGIKNLTKENWLFLILSAVATGFSWLFYFKALQIGAASRVASIDKLSIVFTLILSFLILREPFSWKLIVGVALIVGGSLFILMDK
ncbi:MAG: EamA family transporter [Bacteroidetes bacterium]|nr:EamA family transporter [Bacteroidota bacterium]